MKMLRKILLCLFAALGLMFLANAKECDVWFYPSWIDGVATEYGDRVYIRVLGDEGGFDFYTFTPGQKLTFKAYVEPGHEITKWSREKFTGDVQAARDNGHFSEIINSTSDTLEWTMPSSDQCLGVHEDWLKYTLSYQGNGATSGMAKDLANVIYTNKITLAGEVLAKPGYTLSGWKDAVGSRVFALSQQVTGSDFNLSYTNKSVTLVAQWSTNSYTITFDANGGVFSDGTTTKSKSVLFGQPYGDFPSAPHRDDGFDFGNAWTNHLGQTVNSSTILSMPSNHVLYATWKSLGPYHVDAVKCSDEPGADGVVLGSGTYDWGRTCYLQATESTGSRFVGWTRNATGSEIESTDKVYPVTVTNEVSYFGHFALKEFTVTFVYKDANDNTVSTNQVVKYGQDAVPPNLPARAHYRFLYWDKSYQSVTGDLTVNAVYEATALTVRFDANGGNGKMSDRPADQGQEFVVPLCGFSNGDRSFTGWKGSDGKTYQSGQVITEFNGCVQGIFTLTAQWAETYLVLFDGNGATTGKMTNLTIEVGATFSLPSNRFVRTGHAFSGWATNETTRLSGTVVYADGAEVRDLADLGKSMTLSAVWTANPYRVRFYPNGGEGEPLEWTLSYDEARTLPGANVFARTGYELVGWLEDPTNECAYALGESVSNLTDVANAIVPFFAKWLRVEEDLGAYSVAADCAVERADRLALQLTVDKEEYCQVVTNKNVQSINGENNQYVSLSPTENDGESYARPYTVRLSSAPLSKSGTLSFYYRMFTESSRLKSGKSKLTISLGDSKVIVGPCTTNVQDWTRIEIKVTEEEAQGVPVIFSFETYYNGTGAEDYQDAAFVDNISWLPDNRDLGSIGVTFRLNDGTAAPLDIWSNATYAVGKTIGTLPTPAGERFGGWSTNGYASGKINQTWIVPTADMQLYAVWDSGEHPVPAPGDAPTIGGFAPAAGGFSLSFSSDERFDYRLLSTLTLTPPDWQPAQGVDVKQGTGGALSFEVPVCEGADHTEFFKVEVLQRGAE